MHFNICEAENLSTKETIAEFILSQMHPSFRGLYYTLGRENDTPCNWSSTRKEGFDYHCNHHHGTPFTHIIIAGCLTLRVLG